MTNGDRTRLNELRAQLEELERLRLQLNSTAFIVKARNTTALAECIELVAKLQAQGRLLEAIERHQPIGATLADKVSDSLGGEG